MTQEEFEKRMSVLKDKSMAIQQEIGKLQDEYLVSYPVQPNDMCVDENGKVCWISRMSFSKDNPERVNIMANYQKKDGTRSKREQYLYNKIQMKLED